MHRGNHFGVQYDSSYSRMGRGGAYRSEDNMIEIVQQFREFKPYLKKRLAQIRQTGRTLELQDEVEDINFYLEVMKDILADESHGVDQLRSYIDKIHEMIRKNPLTDLPGVKNRTLDGNDDDFDDNDRPRSPSPETRGSDTAANIPLIPTHGAHRTVEVNFSRNERKEEFDEWGRPISFESTFTRREPYKGDIDMRGGYFQGSSGSGGRDRRWSEESDFSGARTAGRGMSMGRGAPMLPHHRHDQDIRHGRGRGYDSNDFDRRNEFYMDRSREPSKERGSDWFGGGPPNGNKFDDWQSDPSFRGGGDRRSREDEWRMNHSDNRDREEKFHHAQHIAKYFERRPSSEGRREDRQDDYISMFDRRSRHDRPYESASGINNAHQDYNHARRGPHGNSDFHGRGRPEDDRHDPRSRMDAGSSYTPNPAPLMNPITSIPHPPQPSPMGFGVPPPSPHYTNAGLLPSPSPFPNANPPLLPLPVPNAPNVVGMGHVLPNMGPAIPPIAPSPMAFHRPPPPMPNYPVSELLPNFRHLPPPPHGSPPSHAATSHPPPQSPHSHMPQPGLTRPPVPSPVRNTPQHTPQDQYTVPSGSPNFTSPAEPSAEQMREITMMKAKQCFGRVVSRSPVTSSSQSAQGSALSSPPPGPASPTNTSADNQNTLDPRLNRARPTVNHTVQNRQHSPPAPSSDPPRAKQTSRSDAGNVLRPSSSDPRARSRIDQERKRQQETKDRMKQYESSKSSSNNKGSKIQELRKQFEKEGFHRLGKPSKKTVSFEDALNAQVEESDDARSKSGERSKSSSSSHGKDKESESDRQSRSQTDKTEKDRSPKRKSGEKGKGKEEKSSDKKKDKTSTNERTTRNKSSQLNKTDQQADKSSDSETREKPVDPTKPPAFRIPKKPRPKEPEKESLTVISDEQSTQSKEKDATPPEPPTSPEPALSQVPDTDMRTETVEDNEVPSSSTKPSAEESTQSSSSNGMEVLLKKFMTESAGPDEMSFLLSNPGKLQEIFEKIKSEIRTAKGSSADESGGTETSTTEVESEKVPQPEDIQERGRSREKKKNTKRRSSLEKLHDALKEMRFDTMLPLGPRRCTRGGQEEAAAETVDSETPVPTVVPTDEREETVDQPPPEEKPVELEQKISPGRKRGRPPKDSPKKNTVAKPIVQEVELDEEPEGETEENVEEEVEEPEAKTATRRGKKRKQKVAKATPRKRTKKAGPMTRAQAALKNKKDLPKASGSMEGEEESKSEGVTLRKRTKAANNVVIRRLTRKRVGTNDTVVNKGLCKIKLESDFKAKVKTEPAEPDPFLNASVNESNNDQNYLADQLANIIDDNLDNLVTNLESQTEENMDLDVFNTLDGDENVGEVLVKDELDVSLNLNDDAVSDISFEEINTSVSSGPPSKKKPIKGKATAEQIPISSIDAVIAEVAARAEVAVSLPASIEPPTSTSTTKDATTEEESPISEPSNTSTPTTNTPNIPEEIEKSADPSTFVSLQMPGTSNESSDIQVSVQGSKKKKSTPVIDVDDESSLASTTSANGQEEVPVKMEMDDASNDSEDSSIEKLVFSTKCDKCNFSGKKIVPHYVNKHYPCQIPQARLMPATFNGLIELNTSESPQLLEIVMDENNGPIWPCLYCNLRFHKIVDFYDHLTSHTGEFRFECAECLMSYPQQKSLTNHLKSHKGATRASVKLTYPSDIHASTRELTGYLCNDCFYFQLRFENITRHIDQSGHSSLDVKSVRLIRPPLPETVDKKPHVSQTGTVKEPEAQTEVTPNPPEDLAGNAAPSAADECVFFGSNSTFKPPTVASGDCDIIVPRLLERPFFRNLCEKIGFIGDRPPSPSQPIDVEACDDSRKRKRSLSPKKVKTEVLESTDPAHVTDTAAKPVGRPRGVKIRKTVCKPRKPLVQWDETVDESWVDELNDFFIPSDDDSEDSDSDKDSETGAGGFEPVRNEDGTIQNNEHIVRTRCLAPFETPGRFVTLRNENMELLLRPGDLNSSNAVLYGFVPSGLSQSAPHKLRDIKELERLSHVHGARILLSKTEAAMTAMRSPVNLLQLFKCMGTFCDYTTDYPDKFTEHLNKYHYVNGLFSAKGSCSRFLTREMVTAMKNADCCAYCSARYAEAKDLTEHITNQHSQSLFQCHRCFYRCYYMRYLMRHYELAHPDVEPDPIECLNLLSTEVEEATLFQIFVYKCDIDNPECDKAKRYVFREDFTEHLKICAPNRTEYPCHLCKTSFPLDLLIEHYKQHSLFKFHCSYCSYGSEVKADLDEHFVTVHPNTSGRVFYRVKQQPPVTAKPSQSPERKTAKSPKKSDSQSNVEKRKLASTGRSDSFEKDNQDNQSNDTSSMDGDNEDGEKGRVTNLRGRDLYRCVTGECNFVAENIERFKAHVNSCTYVAEHRSLSCAHCERKMKSPTNLLEHIKVHGEKKHVCALCQFKCWTGSEITKHYKTHHRVMTQKVVKEESDRDQDPDAVVYPNYVLAKKNYNMESFTTNYYKFSKKALYSHENVDKLPLNKVFSSEVFCALCDYSTKVRCNMVRHLNIHKQAEMNREIVVPESQRVNPVPYLTRNSLEFDKMMNLAASSHKNNGGAATEAEVKKLPQFVKEQFRYVCSVCDHITSDETLLQTHIKVIHSEVSVYKCPHCHKLPESGANPDNTVSLDKISIHLKLHGQKLFKCGHCTFVHPQMRVMEKHIPEKHPEKKPIHYLIRDLDLNGTPNERSNIPGPSTSSVRRQSVDDKFLTSENWKCFLCSTKSIFGSWAEAKSHCDSVHKVDYQFMCLPCGKTSDDYQEILTHWSTECVAEAARQAVLVFFSKCGWKEMEEANTSLKRNSEPVSHIHGIFTVDSISLMKNYNSSLNTDQTVSVPSSPLRGNPAVPSPSKASSKPSTAATSKARRSVAGSTTPKASPLKTDFSPVTTSPLKTEIFKYRCHKCDMYRTKNPNELRTHLFNEFRYKRWMCLVCATKFTTEKSLKGHIEKDHQKVYHKDLYELQPENMDIEGEIDNCIAKQNRKKDMINSYSVEKFGKLSCKHCKEDGHTYDTFEIHILEKHSS